MGLAALLLDVFCFKGYSCCGSKRVKDQLLMRLRNTGVMKFSLQLLPELLIFENLGSMQHFN